MRLPNRVSCPNGTEGAWIAQPLVRPTRLRAAAETEVSPLNLTLFWPMFNHTDPGGLGGTSQAFFLPKNHPNPLDQNAAEMSFGLLEMSFGVLEMSFGVLEMSFEDPEVGSGAS